MVYWVTSRKKKSWDLKNEVIKTIPWDQSCDFRRKSDDIIRISHSVWKKVDWITLQLFFLENLCCFILDFFSYFLLLILFLNLYCMFFLLQVAIVIIIYYVFFSSFVFKCSVFVVFRSDFLFCWSRMSVNKMSFYLNNKK